MGTFLWRCELQNTGSNILEVGLYRNTDSGRACLLQDVALDCMKEAVVEHFYNRK
jgi:hypothetical protein